MARADSGGTPLDQRFRYSTQPVLDFAVGLIPSDWRALDRDQIAGVHALIHLHQGYAGLGLSGQNAPLTGCGPTVLGKDRAVEVDAAPASGFEHSRRQNLPIGGDQQSVRLFTL